MRILESGVNMNKMISKCPVCNSNLKITTLHCNECGLELKNDFEQSIFDRLSSENYSFLLEFLRCQGNLKLLQDTLGISYPLVKRKLNDLLVALEIKSIDNQVQDTSEWTVNKMSTKASDIIKSKFMECGGIVNIETSSGKFFEVNADDISIGSETALHKVRYEYRVFDYITELLMQHGGQARKGAGRNARLGEPNCTDDTIVGVIGKKYYNKKDGEYTFDPVFILAAIMEWAGIVNNKRGYVELTKEYKLKLGGEIV